MVKVMPWMLLLALAGTFLPATASRAGSLYRCISPQGGISYQDQACAPGSRLDRTLDYPASSQPEPTITAMPVGPTYPVAAPRRRWRHSSRGSLRVHRTSRPRTASGQCHAAKERRRVALDRIGLHRTFEQLSHLDEPVRAVCRGF